MQQKSATQVLKKHADLTKLNNLKSKILIGIDYIKTDKTKKLSHTQTEEAIKSAKEALQQINLDISRLVNNKISGPTSPFLKLTSAEAVEKAFSGHMQKYPKTYTPAEKRYYEMLQAGNFTALKKEKETQLIMEISEKHDKGWYFVLDTLTFRGDSHRAFYSTHNHWKKYVRQVRAIVARSAGFKTRDKRFGHRYFAVREVGAKGRGHIHCLHMFSHYNLPDPNKGRSDRNHREQRQIKQAWKFGYSDAKVVRYKNDNFIKKGWKWPQEDGTPIIAKPITAVAYYVTKYIVKQMELKAWRIKTSQNLGMEILNQWMTKRSNLHLELLMMSAHKTMRVNKQVIPNHLIQKSAIRALSMRHGDHEVSMYAQTIASHKPKTKPSESSTRQTVIRNRQKTILSLMNLIRNSEDFDSQEQTLEQAITEFNHKWKDKNYGYRSTNPGTGSRG